MKAARDAQTTLLIPAGQSILVIGGNSNLAQRLAVVWPAARFVVRRRGPATGPIVVAGYDAIPAVVFDGIDTVINCVGTAAGDAATLQHVNVALAVAAARAARSAGCRRFIQISSLSVYGGAATIDRSTPIHPVSAYGRSKALADATLLALAGDSFVVQIVRAPAIYGPGAAGKFGALARVMRRTGVFPIGRPLAKRSVLHLDNAAACLVALVSRDATSGVDFAADRGRFDLAQLAAAVTRVTTRRVRLVPVPAAGLVLVRAVAPSVYASLYGASVIDPAAAMTAGLPLPVTTSDGLASMLAAEWNLP